MLKHVFSLLLLSLMASGIAAQDATPETGAAPLVPQTLQLTYVPNIQFSPFYVAQASGYFADAGLDVTFQHADEPVIVDLIAANDQQFGIVSGEQVIVARANARPVVFVYAWFQQPPVGIAVTDNSGIDSVEALRGRRVGIPGRFGASYSGLIALLAAHGMTENDIQLEEIGYNAPEVVCVGAIDAVVIYINNEPLQIAERAAAGDCGEVTGMRIFPVGADVNIISNGLITNEEMLATQPERVRAMVGAIDRGVRETIHNPAQAYLTSLDFVENLPITPDLRAALESAAEVDARFSVAHAEASREQYAERRSHFQEDLHTQFGGDEANAPALLQLDILFETITLWDADRLGYSDPAAWTATQDTLVTMGFLSAPSALDAAFTNDYLPPEE